MQSNATDSHDMARFAGILMLAIGLVVSQIVRHSDISPSSESITYSCDWS